MIDKNKVLDALRNCINKPRCANCHWEKCDTFHETFELPKSLVMDMLDLLKDPMQRDYAEIEIEGGGSSWWHVCSECRTAVDTKDKFCRECGKPFKKGLLKFLYPDVEEQPCPPPPKGE